MRYLPQRGPLRSAARDVLHRGCSLVYLTASVECLRVLVGECVRVCVCVSAPLDDG